SYRPDSIVSWSSGVLATLTWWRSLVRIQPGLLGYSRGPAATAAPSHGADRRFESCREYCRPHFPCADFGTRSVPPTLTAEWTGAWLPARSHKPYHVGSNPTSATWWFGEWWFGEW